MDNLILIIAGILSGWYIFHKLFRSAKGKSPCEFCNGSCNLKYNENKAYEKSK